MYAEEYEDYDYDARDYEYGSGDPRMDLAYEKQQYATNQYAQYALPDPVKKFLPWFRDVIMMCRVAEIQHAYDVIFPKLTEDHFKSSPWPEVEEIIPIVGDDPQFIILYKELYYRHIFARVTGGPTIHQRFESYYNYCQLFNMILSAPTPVNLELPNQWLWEVIDEFIYQFQAFAQYRCKMDKKTVEDIEMLKANPRVYSIHSVLNVLHSLIDKSNINKQLEVYAAGGDVNSVAGEFGQRSLYKMLGYFSLIGLLRLHSLLGDFYQALKVLENIELTKKPTYSRVPACQVTTYYYVGFAYMMTRRYSDAIRTFSHILLYIQRMRSTFQTKNYQNDQINKQTEQMYALLAICLVLHPQLIDESLQATLKDKANADRMYKMSRGEIEEFSNCFIYACPKFVSPVAPDYNTTQSSTHMAVLNHIVNVFMMEVKQQLNIPTIRSYLKLYTTLPLKKMAEFLDKSDEEFTTELLCFKHKMRNLVLTRGSSALSGEFRSLSEVDFYIDANMIHIADTKVARRYGDYFIRQIHKFEDLNNSLKSIRL
ncbi:eukaryotic translation initiation factor 3 subunit L-like [Artemia franciscana]|uniref:eukaryotic translation initiation factor 3 subunit L-like n=1 Tax=Artemia franciscana TaxID=6661 RepID=UPI0032DB07F6